MICKSKNLGGSIRRKATSAGAVTTTNFSQQTKATFKISNITLSTLISQKALHNLVNDKSHNILLQ